MKLKMLKAGKIAGDAVSASDFRSLEGFIYGREKREVAAGEVVEVDDAEGQALVIAGAAEPLQ